MIRVTRPLGFLATLLATGALCVVGSGCNLQWSPYAARVGAFVITPAQLDRALRQASSNKDFRCLLEHSGKGGYRFQGAGTSTYDGSFAAYVLTNMIDAQVARATVKRRGLSEPASARALATSQVGHALSAEVANTQCAPATTNVLRQLGSSLAGSFVQLQLDEDALAASAAHVTLSPSGIAAYERANPKSTKESCLSGLFLTTAGEARGVEGLLKRGASLPSLVA
ncbi:MAG: hypothetical protein ACYDBS_02705, partial [Acidimicrobiales bacterium]